MNLIFWASLGLGALALMAAQAPAYAHAPPKPVPAPDEVVLGRRLFRETRFAQYFAAQSLRESGGDVNAPLREGDPVVATVTAGKRTVTGPYAGRSINCASCHFTDELDATLGPRAFSDFARRSPLPARSDRRGATGADATTLRNSPSFVNALISRGPRHFLHYDGEFSSPEALVKAGLTGRNFGWLPDERAAAVRHVARVIREDRSDEPYLAALGLGRGASASSVASDDEILDRVAQAISAYLHSAVSMDSPYDAFLAANRLPQRAVEGQRDVDYGRALLTRLDALEAPVWVDAFGPRQLNGLKVFLREPAAGRASGVGNCVACHAPPAFTDFGFHNTGVAQDEYELLHGGKTFAALAIPARQGDPARWAAIPDAADPARADLGLWNVFAESQRDWLCDAVRARTPSPESVRCTKEELLPFTVARFKTPGLRELGSSAPYLHTGSRATLDSAVRFYAKVSIQARLGLLVNPDPDLALIFLDKEDREAIALFLRSLDSFSSRQRLRRFRRTGPASTCERC